MNFSIEGSKENDLIIKAATRNIKTRTNLLFSLTLQAVRINNRGAPLLGLAKSKYIYYTIQLINRMYSAITEPAVRQAVSNTPCSLSYSVLRQGILTTCVWMIFPI